MCRRSRALTLSRVLLLSRSRLSSCRADLHPAAPLLKAGRCVSDPPVTSSPRDKSPTLPCRDPADSLDVCRSFSVLAAACEACPGKPLLLSGTLACVCRSAEHLCCQPAPPVTELLHAGARDEWREANRVDTMVSEA